MREKALEWWRNLPMKECEEFYNLWLNDPTNNKDWEFAMVLASSSTIEFIYKKFYLQEQI